MSTLFAEERSKKFGFATVGAGCRTRPTEKRQALSQKSYGKTTNPHPALDFIRVFGYNR